MSFIFFQVPCCYNFRRKCVWGHLVFMAKQEHVTKKMSELHYGEQQFHPFMIQDSIEMKFNWPWVRWEVGLSGPFKHFCLEHSSTKELFCSFGSARLLSYWFHNVPPQALILFLDIAQNHVSGGQPALNEEAKSLCILEEKKWVYFHIVCLCVCFCARIRDNQRMSCRESSGDSWSLAVRHLIIGWGPF